jgi:hypothetical protein
MTYAQEHASGIDVGHLEVTGFVDAQPGGVAGHEEHAELGVDERLEEGAEFVGVQDDGERPEPLAGGGNVLHLPGALKGHGVEELQGSVDLAVGGIREFLDLEAVQEEGADVLLVEVGGGASVESGEFAAVKEVVASGGRAEVAQDEILGPAVAPLSPVASPGE